MKEGKLYRFNPLQILDTKSMRNCCWMKFSLNKIQQFNKCQDASKRAQLFLAEPVSRKCLDFSELKEIPFKSFTIVPFRGILLFIF